MSTDRLKVALRGSEDRESQLRADLATSQESAEKERKSAEELKKRLEEAIQGVELQTPSGPLSTGNSAAVQAFLDGQSSRIAVLERKVESSHREREEETTRLKTLLEATKTQSELTMSQLATVKTQLATTKVTLESVEGKLRDKEQEVSELRGDGARREESWREISRKEVETLQTTLVDTMKEKLEEAKMAIQKRDRFIESSRAANEKLRKNEGVYKEAIAELKRYAKEREKELTELYKEMKGLKVIQSI